MDALSEKAISTGGRLNGMGDIMPEIIAKSLLILRESMQIIECRKAIMRHLPTDQYSPTVRLEAMRLMIGQPDRLEAMGHTAEEVEEYYRNGWRDDS